MFLELDAEWSICFKFWIVYEEFIIKWTNQYYIFQRYVKLTVVWTLDLWLLLFLRTSFRVFFIFFSFLPFLCLSFWLLLKSLIKSSSCPMNCPMKLVSMVLNTCTSWNNISFCFLRSWYVECRLRFIFSVFSYGISWGKVMGYSTLICFMLFVWLRKIYIDSIFKYGISRPLILLTYAILK